MSSTQSKDQTTAASPNGSSTSAPTPNTNRYADVMARANALVDSIRTRQQQNAPVVSQRVEAAKAQEAAEAQTVAEKQNQASQAITTATEAENKAAVADAAAKNAKMSNTPIVEIDARTVNDVQEKDEAMKKMVAKREAIAAAEEAAASSLSATQSDKKSKPSGVAIPDADSTVPKYPEPSQSNTDSSQKSFDGEDFKATLMNFMAEEFFGGFETDEEDDEHDVPHHGTDMAAKDMKIEPVEGQVVEDSAGPVENFDQALKTQVQGGARYVVYGAPWCGYTRTAVLEVSKRKLPMQFIDIGEYRSHAYDTLAPLIPQQTDPHQKRTMPQVFFIRADGTTIDYVGDQKMIAPFADREENAARLLQRPTLVIKDSKGKASTIIRKD